MRLWYGNGNGNHIDYINNLDNSGFDYIYILVTNGEVPNIFEYLVFKGEELIRKVKS